ncbi:hypothetical protein BDR22DRAFT_854739 [Usnea florida]
MDLITRFLLLLSFSPLHDCFYLKTFKVILTGALTLVYTAENIASNQLISVSDPCHGFLARLVHHCSIYSELGRGVDSS